MVVEYYITQHHDSVELYVYFTNEISISFWCSASQEMRNSNTIQPALAMLGIQKR